MNNSILVSTEPENYDLFFRFIDYYKPTGFEDIDPRSKLMLELERMMERNNQFFFFGDLLQMKIYYTSKLSASMLGIDQNELTPYHLFEATHPDDLHRFTLARAKMFKMAEELFIAERGHSIISTSFRIRNSNREYIHTLFQCFLFYTSIPNKTVFLFQINTNIDWCKKLQNSHHYYVGTDLSYFTIPNEKLLKTGNIFTKREFEIIKMIDTGLKSEMIAERLFISAHTVNTHRRTLLKKSGKATTSELIFELKEQGLL
jgi:DNA-binding CsgD family transcriptional regulator